MLTSVTDALGNVTNFQYDANGNLLQIQRPLSVQFQFAYDSYGELLSLTDAMGNTSTIAYDANGNPTMLTDALGNLTQLQVRPASPDRPGSRMRSAMPPASNAISWIV